MTGRRRFEPVPASIPAARHFATEALGGASDEVLEVIPLLVSELATNCIRHTESGFELTVSINAREIRVEATDHGSGEPRMRTPEPTDPTGRGLQIIDLFATTWGVQHLPGGGKTVWFTLAVGAPVGASC